jgi:hypothetical protein
MPLQGLQGAYQRLHTSMYVLNDTILLCPEALVRRLLELLLPPGPSPFIKAKPDTPSRPGPETAAPRPEHTSAPIKRYHQSLQTPLGARTWRRISLRLLTGCGFSKTPRYAWFMASKSRMSVMYTFTLMTLPSPEPAASRTAWMFFRI